MRLLFLATIFTFLGFSQALSQGIDFFHGTWEEALEAAKAQEKIIFVDAYTTWCGPCKRMAKNVFPLEEVGAFFNENFISMKIDMEKEEGLKFQRKYPVSAYPTFYFIDEKGETVLQTKGGRSAEQFVDLARSAVGKVDRSVDYVKAYEEGNREPDLVYNYVRALNKAGKSSLKIANDYIRSQKDLTTPQNLKFILEATTQADSRIFDLLIENRKAIETITSKEEVQNKIEKACQTTLQTAIEFSSEDLLNEAKDKMKKHFSEIANTFAYKADMKYYSATLQPEKYLKACNTYVKKEIKKDASKLHNLAASMLDAFPKNKEVVESAEGIAKKAAKSSDSFEYYQTYARILHKNGKKKEALAAANKCLELAKDKQRDKQMAERLIQMIENS